VPDLEFVRVLPGGPDEVREHWRKIHNLIIPTSPLSEADVEERAARNHLEVAFATRPSRPGPNGVGTAPTPVGCSTVRPPDEGAATVIARVTPKYRRRGFGTQIYLRSLQTALDLGAESIVTVVLASNEDGLAFAQRHGFVEFDRYLLPGDTIPFIDLRL
jgi:GNAT superfamily N-acetyltransferase